MLRLWIAEQVPSGHGQHELKQYSGLGSTRMNYRRVAIIIEFDLFSTQVNRRRGFKRRHQQARSQIRRPGD